MTKAELNQVLLDGITQSVQADKTLPENLADRYVDWIHGLIKQGQAKQSQKMLNMPSGEDEQAPAEPQMQGA